MLSGGQRKLLELARVLVAEPRLILLDEPGAGVNPALLDPIVERIAALNRQGVTFLIIEHNMDLVMSLCRPVMVMAQGRAARERHGRRGAAPTRAWSRPISAAAESPRERRRSAVEALEAGYEPGLPIVRGASLAVARDEILAMLGPNGAGKSTLVKAVAGLVPVSSGRVRPARARRSPGGAAHRLVHEGLAFVPQTENVFVNLSVEDNLDLCAAILQGAAPASALRGAVRAVPRPRAPAPPAGRAALGRAAADARGGARARRRPEAC